MTGRHSLDFDSADDLGLPGGKPHHVDFDSPADVNYFDGEPHDETFTDRVSFAWVVAVDTEDEDDE